MNLSWIDNGWEDYLSWQNDRAILRRIHLLLKDIWRSPYVGIGRPEELKHEFSGWWSREIDGKHRIVYRMENGTLYVLQCRGHYNDK